MKNIFVITGLLFWLSVKTQPPSRFIVKFGGGGVDVGYGVKETYNRQYIVIGSTTSFGMGAADAYLVLIDSMGQVAWEKTFGGSSSDVGKSVLVNPLDSGFVFTGYTSSYGNGGYDIYIVRTDKNGNLKWQKSYGGLDWDFGNDLTFSSDGNVIVCGNTFSSTYGKRDATLLKVNINNGNLIWQKTYGGAEDDEFQAIKNTSDGYYTLAGNTKSYGDLNNDFWLFKINTSGDSIISVPFGNSNKGEKCYDFTEDNNNNLVFCGSYDTSFYNIGKNISYVIKTNLNGGYINELQISGAFTLDDKFSAITNIKSGNLYFFSRKVNHTGFGIDVQPYLLNYNFIFLGTNTYGEYKEDEMFDVISTKYNGFLMVGRTNSYNLVSDDVFLIKLDSSLFNAQLLVGIDNISDNDVKRDIYYFDNVIYLQNPKNQILNYQVLNSNGVIVKGGSVSEDFITLDPHLRKDIYIVWIPERNLKIKFIKE